MRKEEGGGGRRERERGREGRDGARTLGRAGEEQGGEKRGKDGGGKDGGGGWR